MKFWNNITGYDMTSIRAEKYTVCNAYYLFFLLTTATWVSGIWKVTGIFFSRSQSFSPRTGIYLSCFSFPQPIILPLLLHTHLSAPTVVCNSLARQPIITYTTNELRVFISDLHLSRYTIMKLVSYLMVKWNQYFNVFLFAVIIWSTPASLYSSTWNIGY